ncbi:hypothetical protein IWQ49_006427 [Labrenzia sp. EL_126]|nr:hypothetical protein [Labrenzia sp. EL_126]
MTTALTWFLVVALGAVCVELGILNFYDAPEMFWPAPIWTRGQAAVAAGVLLAPLIVAVAAGARLRNWYLWLGLLLAIGFILEVLAGRGGSGYRFVGGAIALTLVTGLCAQILAAKLLSRVRNSGHAPSWWLSTIAGVVFTVLAIGTAGYSWSIMEGPFTLRLSFAQGLTADQQARLMDDATRRFQEVPELLGKSEGIETLDVYTGRAAAVDPSAQADVDAKSRQRIADELAALTVLFHIVPRQKSYRGKRRLQLINAIKSRQDMSDHPARCLVLDANPTFPAVFDQATYQYRSQSLTLTETAAGLGLDADDIAKAMHEQRSPGALGDIGNITVRLPSGESVPLSSVTKIRLVTDTLQRKDLPNAEWTPYVKPPVGFTITADSARLSSLSITLGDLRRAVADALGNGDPQMDVAFLMHIVVARMGDNTVRLQDVANIHRERISQPDGHHQDIPYAIVIAR